MMKDTERPESLENRWDILYRDYPEVYDEFARIPRKPSIPEVINKMFNLKERVILDIGSGTGLSAFGLAPYAKYVIGIEPEDAMLKVAIARLERRPTANVEFIQGRAEDIPLKGGSVDSVTAVTAGPNEPNALKAFAGEAARVLRQGGFIATVDIPPRWYGGELAPIILGRGRRTGDDTEGVREEIFLRHLDFKHKDFFQIQDYGSVERIVDVYGFIYGREAIDYLRKHNKTTIRWKFRIHYKKV